MQPIIDIHIHIQPLDQFKPEALTLVKKGRKDYDEVAKYSGSPVEFLKFLDRAGIERAGLINYVSPEVVGFTPAVNDWIANYCAADPKRLRGMRPSRFTLPVSGRDPSAKFVAIVPGARALTVMPSGASSNAIVRVIAATPALLTE